MPLQQISVSPLDWSKETTNSNQRRQENWKIPEPVFTTSGSNHLERCPSQSSTLSNNNDICRICHCEGDEEVPLIAPCYCAGSLRYVHQACLQQWIKSSDIRCCELCKFVFIMQSKLKPVNEWESLDMSGVERRKLLCSVTFHAIAVTCVIWSLYVLIDRTADEVQRGVLEWPFWTKLIVVAIGFTAGIVFMYIQCKAYLHLCRRWRAYNRVIYVQNAPEKVALPPAEPIRHQLAHQDSTYVVDTCCGVDAIRRNPEVVHVNIGPNLPTRKVRAEDTVCLDIGCGDLKCVAGEDRIGDSLKVIVATSSGTNFLVEPEIRLSKDVADNEVEETCRLLEPQVEGVTSVPDVVATTMRKPYESESPVIQPAVRPRTSGSSTQSPRSKSSLGSQSPLLSGVAGDRGGK